MALPVPPHDPGFCAHCIERRAQEFMVPADSLRLVGHAALLMAQRYHPRRPQDLAAGRVGTDPDADRETLYGDPT